MPESVTQRIIPNSRKLIQDYSANFGGSEGPVGSVSCRVSAVAGNGVVIACGDEYVLVPARVTRP